MAPSSTGYHLQSGAGPGNVDALGAPWTGITGRGVVDSTSQANTMFRSLLQPLHRIQSANFNFTVNRTDVNEFGVLSRLDTIVMDAPTVSLDFSYYLTDGGNERKLGFNCPTASLRDGGASAYNTGDLCNSGKSALSGHLGDSQGNNYFIAISKDGTDAANNPITADSADFNVVAIGNGYVSDYSVEASVGSIPSASVSVEAFNIKVDDLASGSPSTGPLADPNIPAVDITGGTTGTYGSSKQYIIPTYLTGNTSAFGTDLVGHVSALRPGDITLTIGDSSNYQGLADLSLAGQAHIQSFNISVPMSRTTLPRLGSTFGYGKVIDTPINISCTISAIVSELQASSPQGSNFKGNVFEMLGCMGTQSHDLTLTLNNCDKTNFGSSDTPKMVSYTIKNARMEGESFSSSIGDNQTVDITFTAQVGGANDDTNGILMQGNYEPWSSLTYWPMGENKDEDSAYGE
jgi:hypothetical protein